MTRYRQKPVEVEAWQVGSDEPRPDWIDDESLRYCPHGGWVVNDNSRAGLYWVGKAKFEQTYEVIE